MSDFVFVLGIWLAIVTFAPEMAGRNLGDSLGKFTQAFEAAWTEARKDQSHE